MQSGGCLQPEACRGRGRVCSVAELARRRAAQCIRRSADRAGGPSSWPRSPRRRRSRTDAQGHVSRETASFSRSDCASPSTTRYRPPTSVTKPSAAAAAAKEGAQICTVKRLPRTYDRAVGLDGRSAPLRRPRICDIARSSGSPIRWPLRRCYPYFSLKDPPIAALVWRSHSESVLLRRGAGGRVSLAFVESRGARARQISVFPTMDTPSPTRVMPRSERRRGLRGSCDVVPTAVRP